MFTDKLVAQPLLSAAFGASHSGLVLLVGALFYCWALMWLMSALHRAGSALVTRGPWTHTSQLYAAACAAASQLRCSSRAWSALDGEAEAATDAVRAATVDGTLHAGDAGNKRASQASTSIPRRRLGGQRLSAIALLVLLATRPSMLSGLLRLGGSLTSLSRERPPGDVARPSRSSDANIHPLAGRLGLAGSLPPAPVLQAGIDHMVHDVALVGRTLRAKRSPTNAVTNATGCFRACEAEPRCHQFTFKAPLVHAADGSPASRPLCLLKGKDAVAERICHACAGRRVAISGRVTRTPRDDLVRMRSTIRRET